MYDLVNTDNFDFDKMCDYLLSDKGDILDEYGGIKHKNKSKSRFFQSFIHYLDVNNDVFYPTKTQLQNLQRIFFKLKDFETYKYNEMILISSYDNYLYDNYGDGDKFEEILENWIRYCLRIDCSNYRRIYFMIQHNKKHLGIIFSIKILKLLVDHVKKNCRFIINAFKNDNFDKDFKLLYLLFSLLSFKEIIGFDGYHDYMEGIIAFFNGVHEVFFSFFLNKEWHGIYNDNEYNSALFDFKYENDVFDEEEKEDDPHEHEIKKKCFSFHTDGIVRFFIYLGYPLEMKIDEKLYLEHATLLVNISTQFKKTEVLNRTDSYYKTYIYYLYQNTAEGILSLISITPFIQKNLYNELLDIIYKNSKLFINYGNIFDLKRDFGETIETLLGLCEFNFHIMVEFIRFFLDSSRGNFNNKKSYEEKYKLVHFVRLFKNIDLSISLPLISLQCQKLNIKTIDFFDFVLNFFELNSVSNDLKQKLLIGTIFKCEKIFLPLITSKKILKKFTNYYKYAFQLLKQEKFLQHPEFIYCLFSNMRIDNIKQQFVLSNLDMVIIVMDFNYIEKFLIPVFQDKIQNSFYYKIKQEMSRVVYNFNKKKDKEIPKKAIETIIYILLNDISTNNLRKLNLAMVSKEFYNIVKYNINNSTTIPVEIGQSIYNIKEDNIQQFSLLKPKSVRYLKYSVSRFLDPSLSILKIFKSLEILEIHGMTELEANSIEILDSMVSLKKIIIKTIPFERFNEFFKGFRDLYGYLKDQYLENRNDYESLDIDLNSFPKEFNIKKKSFSDFSRESCGKTFYIHIKNFKGRYDKRLNQLNILKFNTVTIQSISTSCYDFFTYYHTSYNMCRSTMFTIVLNELPPENVIFSFKKHPLRNKQEKIESIEFVINQTLKLQYLFYFLRLLKNCFYLERFSLILVYNKLGTSLEKDYENNKLLCDSNCSQVTIQKTINELFNFFSQNKPFAYVKKIEISDQSKSTIDISWKDINFLKYQPLIPYRYIYFEK